MTSSVIPKIKKRLMSRLILVKHTHSPVPKKEFSQEILNEIAELIIAGEGFIQPLVVKTTHIDEQMNQHYDVVANDLIYHAACLAREMDLRRGESINAYIIDDDNQSVITAQLALVGKLSTTYSFGT